MSTPEQRLPAVDLLKAAASQFIVLHHLAAYGPLSEAVQEAAPTLVAWLYDHARIAVQVFLVVGGYLSARSLGALGKAGAEVRLAAIANRYLRLVAPFAAALALTVICAAIARLACDDDDLIPAVPTLAQGLAHLTLSHGVLGFESLTVGAWYVAIDFQLFVVFALFSWQAARAYHSRALLMLLTGGAMAASLFWFNRNPAWDAWAPYFFGAYGLGAWAWCAQRSRRPLLGLGFMAVLGVAALLVDFRWRILVALASALALGLGGGRIDKWAAAASVRWLGKISYSLFLVHFPVLLLANAAYALGDGGVFVGVCGFVAAWGASLAAAAVFHRWIEAPAARLRIASLRLPAFARRLLPAQ